MRLFARHFLLQSIAGLAAFVVYLLTLAPTVTYIDSGELAGAAITLGVAHPTGYPLFTLLGHLWSRLPLPGSPIYRMNLFSAFLTALSVVVFFDVTRRLLRRCEGVRDDPAAIGLGAFAASLTYAFARTIWDQATSIEVYALHLLLLTVVIALFLRAVFSQTPRPADFALWALALGLSFANHLTTIFLAPAMLYLYFKRLGFSRRAFATIGVMALPFLAGLAVYLYLPLRSGPHFPFTALGIPEYDWGRVSRGLDKFLYHVTGKQYQIWMFAGSWAMQLGVFLKLWPFQLAILGFIPLAAGVWRIFKRSREVFWFLSLLFVACAGYAVNYAIDDIASYFALAFMASLWFLAMGLVQIVREHREYALAALVFPALALGLNYRYCDRSGDYMVLDYARNQIANLEQTAVLISTDWVFNPAFEYLQRVEGVRRDVVLLDPELMRRTWYPLDLRRAHPELFKPVEREFDDYIEELERFESGKPYDAGRLQERYIGLINAVIRVAIGTRPVCVAPQVLRGEAGVAVGYALVPAGFVLRLVRPGAPAPALRAEFDLERMLATRRQVDSQLQEWLFRLAADGVRRASRYAATTGEPDRAQQLEQLAARLERRAAE